ncbi:MAG TPA: FmdB family zinc ribbon protein [Acidimicrobiales bacterium]|nr:FmdB family zinc ribbon protein [Acidimicrobiales bacterium]
MPTYEYRCRECGEHLEVVQSFSDDPLTECPACTGPLRKVFNSVGIAFKGSGFYKNDSRSSSSSSSSSTAGSAAGGSSGSSAGGSSGSSDGGSTSSDTSTGSKAGGDSSSSTAAASTA